MRKLSRELIILDVGTDFVGHLLSMRKSPFIRRALNNDVLVVRRLRGFYDRGLGRRHDERQ
jgi:hypothetical protein